MNRPADRPVRRCSVEQRAGGDVGAPGDGIGDVAVHMPRLPEARALSHKDLAVITMVGMCQLEPVEGQ